MKIQNNKQQKKSLGIKSGLYEIQNEVAQTAVSIP